MEEPSVLAVIPGLAPGLVALLPQLVLVLLATLLLVLSPRNWWRAAVAVVRHPLRTLSGAVVLALLAFGARALVDLWPAPPAALEIVVDVGGCPMGDRFAARSRGIGRGPLLPPVVSSPAYKLRPGDVVEASVAVTWDDASGALTGRRLGDGVALWEAPLQLNGRLTAMMAVPRRGKAAAGSPVLVTVSDLNGRALIRGTDLRSGAQLGSVSAGGAPQAVVAVVDDRVIAVVDSAALDPPSRAGGSLLAVSIAALARSGDAQPEWVLPRRHAPVRAFAGDDEARVYVLDDALTAVDVGSGQPCGTLLFESAHAGWLPARLAVHRGLAFVLLTAPPAAGGQPRAKMLCLELHGRGARAAWDLLWSREIAVPHLEEIGLAAGALAWIEGSGAGAALRVITAASGDELARCVLPAAPSTPLALDGAGVYVGLEDGRVLRYSPAAGSVTWSVDIRRANAGGEIELEAPASALLAIDSAVIAFTPSGRAFVLAEREDTEASAAWGHWRGGPECSGAGPDDGDTAPIGPPAGAAFEPAATARAGFATALVPLDEGFVVTAVEARRASAIWLSDRCEPLARVDLDGAPGTTVRSGQRVFVALSHEKGAVVRALDLLSSDGGARRIEPAWAVEVGEPLATGAALCAGAGRVLISAERSLAAVSARDGTPIWRRNDLGGALLVMSRGRAFAALGRGAFALDSASGATLWTSASWPRMDGPVAVSARGARVFVLGAAERDGAFRLVCLDADDGGIVFTRDAVPGPYLAAAEEGPVVAGAARILGFDASGEPRLDIALPWRISAPLLVARGLVIASGREGLAAWDSLFGDAVWNIAVGESAVDGGDWQGPAALGPVLVRGRIYAASGAGLRAYGGN